MHRLLPALCVAALLAVPSSAFGDASVQGSSLQAPSNATFGCEAQPLLASPQGDYSLFQSGQPDCTWWNTGGGTVPGDGTVQKVTIKSGPHPAQVRFVVIRTLGAQGPGSTCCFFVAETNVAQPAPNAVQSFVVNLPVERNTNTQTGVVTQDTIGVSAVSGTGTLPVFDNGRHNASDSIDPALNASWYYPRLSSATDTGGGRRPDGGIGGYEVLLQTTFCPAGQTCGAAAGNGGSGTGQGQGTAPADRTAPVVGAPALRPSVFRVGPAPFAVAAAVKARGAKLSFRLSEPATVLIAVQKPSAGRRSKGACRRPSRKLRKAKRCTRWTTARTLTRTGQPAGVRSLAFSGRIGRRALKPGAYRVAITAVDAAGNRSKAGTATFRIVR